MRGGYWYVLQWGTSFLTATLNRFASSTCTLCRWSLLSSRFSSYLASSPQEYVFFHISSLHLSIRIKWCLLDRTDFSTALPCPRLLALGHCSSVLRLGLSWPRSDGKLHIFLPGTGSGWRRKCCCWIDCVCVAAKHLWASCLENGATRADKVVYGVAYGISGARDVIIGPLEILGSLKLTQ